MSEREKDPDTARPRVLLIGTLGAVLLWLAQPPAGWWLLAWLAPACWLGLAEVRAKFGPAEYLRIWVGGVLYWLLAVHWVRLPHPLTPLGWLPLAMYLGVYPVLLVATVRAARHASVPLWIAAPIAWTGLEFLQARLFTGFLMGAVSHTQAGQPWIRSVAAYVGAYGVTFLVILFASTTALFVYEAKTRNRYRRFAAMVAAALLAFVVGRAARAGIEIEQPEGQRPLVALIQGDTRATWDYDSERGQRIMERQVELTARARRQAEASQRQLDLVVWPECMFRSYLNTFEGELQPPADVTNEALTAVDLTESWFRIVVDKAGGAAALVGIDRFDWRREESRPGGTDVYNCAALVDGAGQVLATYDKTHLVPFGEYIPFASGMPVLYYLTPMSSGLQRGAGPVGMNVPTRAGGSLRVCPSICYETVVPRVIRRHVAELSNTDVRPDVLVNVTNDAWFWGSSELDMHLACGVFRAIENGLPLLVAANGGLSGVVDAAGEVLQVSPRQNEAVLLAEVPPRTVLATPYSVHGDWFAGLCLGITALFGLGCCRLSRLGRSAWGLRCRLGTSGDKAAGASS